MGLRGVRERGLRGVRDRDLRGLGIGVEGR